MATINLIYSFDGQPQQFTDMQLPEIMVKDKETLFCYLTAPLSEIEKANLAKISCCIYGQIKVPEFYNECNGKFWDIEIIHYMAKIWDVKSKITPVNTEDQFPELFTAATH